EADAAGDANITAAVVCDIKVVFDLTKFPPGLTVEPKVTELGLDLVDVKLRKPGASKEEKSVPLNNDLKELLRGGLKAAEPAIKDAANRAIAQSLKEGKGGISADTIMKTLPKPKK